MDFGVLTNDLLSNVAFLALPPLLWLLLYLWAWEDEPTARAAGFGRRTFWLLVPSAFIASLANAPVFGWNGSALAVNLGGAAIPAALSLYLIYRWWGSDGRAVLARFLTALAAITAGLFALVLFVASPVGGPWARYFLRPPMSAQLAMVISPLSGPVPAAVVIAGAAGTSLFLWIGSSSPTRPSERAPASAAAGGLIALTLVALLLTFYTTNAVAGQGILSSFPYYLLAPIAVGALAVPLAGRWFDLPAVAGVAIGYAASTFGVLVGADVLHQPPLYAGAPSILSIGGAGVLDLVYLSGLISLATSFVVLRLSGAGGTAATGPGIGAASRSPPTSNGLFREAIRQLRAGSPTASLELAASSADASVDQVRTLRGLPIPAPGEPPWAGLEVPAWVSGDHLNLRALARARPVSFQDAERGLLTARFLRNLARQLEMGSFGTVVERSVAFGIDLAIITGPALGLWAALALLLPGSAESVLLGIPYNTALFAYTAAGFLYFLLNEAFTGTTPGKRIRGLEVRTRSLVRPGFVPVLVRNAPRVLPLTVIAELVGVALVVLLRSGTGAVTSGTFILSGLDAVILLLAGLVAVGVIGLASAAVMMLHPEHGRLGDVFAGTWVLRKSPPWPPVPPPPVPAAVPYA
ncbi:MAG TPA: DUF1614 domain-containing protein [Thermoplasmata archaeon]|nr:DUF1614 domain-containing protein [Thermoplasmata archaeon]